ALRRQRHIDPAHRAAKFPGRGKMLRWRARRDGAARIALELVLAAQLEIALDRQEPARNALPAGHRVPEIIDAGVVKPGQRHRTRRLTVLLEIAHRPRDQPQYPGDIDIHSGPPCIFHPRNIDIDLYKSTL